MSSQAEIVNAALAELGSTSRIVTLADQANPHARTAREVWDVVLDDLLDRHPWNFAIRRVVLNEATEAVSFGYDRAFRLPADCVRWLPPSRFGHEPGQSGRWFDGEREGDMILTNSDAPLECRYIARIDQPHLWFPAFQKAMVIGLAASMAEAVTQDESIKDRLQERFDRQIRIAKRRDGLESGPRRRHPIILQSDILTARRYGVTLLGRG